LVALHETTRGVPFAEIVVDEYRRIIPPEAQLLYLDVCTLNRLGAPVRAGLISRVSGIHFEDFAYRFLKPLEHVVLYYQDRYADDFMYTARHQHIAELLFDTLLTDPEDKFNQIVRLVRHMNIDYACDEEAFRQVIRGRTLAETFESCELGRRIYDIAQEIAVDHPNVLQHRGIYEMSHQDGSLEHAASFIERAAELRPYDRAIQHSQAALAREQALKAKGPILRVKLRARARERISGLVGPAAYGPYGFHTKALLALDELKDLSAEIDKGQDELLERRFVAVAKEVEDAISEGQQLFPEDERFLTTESQFRDLINRHDRAEHALREAFKTNPRQDWLAVRLSRRLVTQDDIEGAKGVLSECLSHNPTSRIAHLEMAKLLMRSGQAAKGLVLDHLKHSFTEGDSNFDAQFWYAREMFLQHEYDQAAKMFASLRSAPIRTGSKLFVRGMIVAQDGHALRWRGLIVKKEDTYFLVRTDSFRPLIFGHVNDNSDDWEKIDRDCTVEFEIGFCMEGARATRAHIV
jgi:tetratricopeptide (TPR) repeat protein